MDIPHTEGRRHAMESFFHSDVSKGRRGKDVCPDALCVLFFHFRLSTQYRKYMHLRDRTFHRPSRYSNIDGRCQKPDSRDARKSNRGRRHDEIVISFAKCRQIKKTSRDQALCKLRGQLFRDILKTLDMQRDIAGLGLRQIQLIFIF